MSTNGLTASRISICAAVLFAAPIALAEYEVTKTTGGPLQIERGGIEIAQGSSLRHEKITLNDPDCPIRIEEVIVNTVRPSSGFRLTAKMNVTALRDVSAFEIHTRVFDVFGQQLGGAIKTNLVLTEITDLAAGQSIPVRGTWAVSDEMATQRLTAVTYVHQVRVSDNTIWLLSEEELGASIEALGLRLIFSEAD